MPDIARIQQQLRATGVDGWLLCDFHNRDKIGYAVLGLDFAKFTSRRWFYWIPANGEPARLCSKVEPHRLDDLPGPQHWYLSWRELHDGLKALLGGAKTVAMQWSPDCNIPYVSIVDGGTVDLVRRLGYEVVSSAGLVQTFQAVLDDAAYRSHLEACTAGAEDQGRGVRADRQRAARRPHVHPVRRAAVHPAALRRGGADLHGREPDGRHQRASRRPALRADARERPPDPQGRHGADRPVGQARRAGRDLLRHHLVRLRREEPSGEVRGDLQHRARRPRRGGGLRPRALRDEADGAAAGKWTTPAATW